MKEVAYLESLSQAETLLKPARLDVLRQLTEPRTCSEAGQVLGQTPQWVYYHVKKLVAAGLVAQISSRQVRGINEGIYQATARSFRLSPRLLATDLPVERSDEQSLGFLVNLIEDVQEDLATLSETIDDTSTLGITGVVKLLPEQRQEFLSDLRSTLEKLLIRYSHTNGEALRIAAACYPEVSTNE